MAKRLRPHHQEDVKAKIQASQLINFVQNHALNGGEVNQTRIDAAKFLLNKVVSNAPTEIDKKTEHSGTVNHAHVVVPDLTKDEWMASHGLGTTSGAAE